MKFKKVAQLFFAAVVVGGLSGCVIGVGGGGCGGGSSGGGSSGGGGGSTPPPEVTGQETDSSRSSWSSSEGHYYSECRADSASQGRAAFNVTFGTQSVDNPLTTTLAEHGVTSIQYTDYTPGSSEQNYRIVKTVPSDGNWHSGAGSAGDDQGNMWVLNGAVTADKVVMRFEDINVLPNSLHVFQMNVANIVRYKSLLGNGTVAEPYFIIRVLDESGQPIPQPHLTGSGSGQKNLKSNRGGFETGVFYRTNSMTWKTAQYDINTGNNNRISIEVIDGRTASSANDFALDSIRLWGCKAEGTISGKVFNDLNNDDVYLSSDDEPRAVKVKLFGNGKDLNQEANTRADDARYTLYVDDLDPNICYQVQFEEVSDAPFVDKNVGSNEAIDSDVNKDGLTDCIYLSLSNNSVSSVDAGYQKPTGGLVMGYIWEDISGNNLYDRYEPAFANVSVSLVDANTGTPLGQSVNTDADGFYSFSVDAADAGRYYVDFSNVDANYDFVEQGNGSNEKTDSDVVIQGVDGSGNQQSDGYSREFDIVAGSSVTYINAGLTDGTTSAIVEGNVWFDSNNDGFNNDSQTQSGITIVLRDNQGTEVANLVTDDSGTYRFNVDFGTYFVDVDEATLGTGNQFVKSVSPHSNVNHVDGRSVAFTLDQNNGNKTVNVGISNIASTYPLGAGQAAILVVTWEDDGDGVRQQGETTGVDIQGNVYRDGANQTVFKKLYNGVYIGVVDVNAGSYSAQIDPLGLGHFLAKQNQGDDDYDSDFTATQPYTATVGALNVGDIVELGAAIKTDGQSEYMKIEGTVFYDKGTNPDGVYNANVDNAISSQPVLSLVNSDADQEVGSVRVKTDGSFEFIVENEGNYYIQVTNPPANGGQTEAVGAGQGNYLISPVTTTTFDLVKSNSSTNPLIVNLGYLPNGDNDGEISGKVFVEKVPAEANGSLDANSNEVVAADVEVELWLLTPPKVGEQKPDPRHVETVKTGSAGDYKFENLDRSSEYLLIIRTHHPDVNGNKAIAGAIVYKDRALLSDVSLDNKFEEIDSLRTQTGETINIETVDYSNVSAAFVRGENWAHTTLGNLYLDNNEDAVKTLASSNGTDQAIRYKKEDAKQNEVVVYKVVNGARLLLDVAVAIDQDGQFVIRGLDGPGEYQVELDFDGLVEYIDEEYNHYVVNLTTPDGTPINSPLNDRLTDDSAAVVNITVTKPGLVTETKPGGTSLKEMLNFSLY